MKCFKRMKCIPVIQRASYLSKVEIYLKYLLTIDFEIHYMHIFVCKIVIDDCDGSALIDPASYDKRCRNLQQQSNNNEHENCSKYGKTNYVLEIITYFLYGLTKQYHYGVVRNNELAMLVYLAILFITEI